MISWPDAAASMSGVNLWDGSLKGKAGQIRDKQLLGRLQRYTCTHNSHYFAIRTPLY